MRDIKVVDKNCRQKTRRETVQVRVPKIWHCILKEESNGSEITISKILEEILGFYYGKKRYLRARKQFKK